MALANVALTNTFDEWRLRTNQIIVALDQNDTITSLAYDKANAANVLAFNTGIGANNWANTKLANTSGATFAGYLSITGNVGIGVSNATSKVVISENAATPQSPISSTIMHVAGADNQSIRLLLDTYGTGNPVLNFRKALGTAAAPSAVGFGNSIALITSFGYGATAYSGTSRASIQSFAEENWTDTAHGTRWTFSTTANGTTVLAERMRITESGRIGINTTSPSANLDVTGNVNVTSALNIAGMNVVPTVQAAYDKANSANILAFNTGIGANSYMTATVAGANTAVGAGANTVGVAAFAKANAAMPTTGGTFSASIAVNAGANTGYTSLITGGVGVPGYLAFFTGEGTRRGYIGWNSGGNLQIQAENSFNWTFGTAPLVDSNVMWHAGNDGAGSGLDADTVDGSHANAFALLTGATFTGSVSANSSSTYGLQGYSTANYGILGKTHNSTYGGVLGYNQDGTKYGILGHTTAYSFYGSGTMYNSGDIQGTGNITAYFSDRRLKENIENIDNALELVSRINGVYYTRNDLAKSFGYKDEGTQMGVIAQEIQEVVPSAVALAPFDTEYDHDTAYSKSGENYLTVRYEKLIPLLIEAIKELERKVNDLTKRT